MLSPRTITAIVEGQQIGGFISGSIESSIITPADAFVLRVPLTEAAWRTFRTDARIKIQVDGVTMLDGFIERRDRDGRGGTLEIGGRDRAGRLCDESAPAIDYSGLSILEAVRRLASPWFEPSSVVLTNARNRRLRRGKGRRVAAGNEPVVTINVRVPKRGQVHPGESRWNLIKEILSRAGLMGWSSADGKEFVICKPNQTQPPQYLMRWSPGSTDPTDARDFKIVEDSGDRFSLYLCAGAGGQGDTNYGTNVTDNRGRAFDNPFNKLDGTGRDFIHPKRMFLPERAFDSFGDAQRVAENEKARRDYKRHIATIEMPDMGQQLEPGEITYFAPDTVSRVIDRELNTDDIYYVVSCHYNFSRDRGDWTTMTMVPTGTEIVL